MFLSLWLGYIESATRPALSTVLGLNITSLSEALVAVAGGGILLFAAGYLIGTLTQFGLALWFSLRFRLGWSTHRYYWGGLSEECQDRLWRVLQAPEVALSEINRELFACQVFDHGILHSELNGLHLWIARRWTAFTIAANSVTALVMSLLIGFVVNASGAFNYSHLWAGGVGVVVVLLAIKARTAWTETMGMLEFATHLPWIGSKKLTMSDKPVI
jgi:hypothetical protein